MSYTSTVSPIHPTLRLLFKNWFWQSTKSEHIECRCSSRVFPIRAIFHILLFMFKMCTPPLAEKRAQNTKFSHFTRLLSITRGWLQLKTTLLGNARKQNTFHLHAKCWDFQNLKFNFTHSTRTICILFDPYDVSSHVLEINPVQNIYISVSTFLNHRLIIAKTARFTFDEVGHRLHKFYSQGSSNA